jgi:hypothetical protein
MQLLQLLLLWPADAATSDNVYNQQFSLPLSLSLSLSHDSNQGGAPQQQHCTQTRLVTLTRKQPTQWEQSARACP